MRGNQHRIPPSLLLVCLWLALQIQTCQSNEERQQGLCYDDNDCVNRFGIGSKCNIDDGRRCTNPFQQGCLLRKHNSITTKRVCNSDDTDDVIQNGDCRTPQLLEYMEIRLFNHNWESIFFENWIIQIVLSEILDVPTSIETGYADRTNNFYAPYDEFQYGSSHDLRALDKSLDFINGDCRYAKRGTKGVDTSSSEAEDDEDEEYEICAHAALEIWSMGNQLLGEMIRSHVVEPHFLGVLGQEGWYITKFTAQQDESLLSYLGMQGEVNRQKLADTFLRPTTWLEYCERVSSTNCEIPDDIAQRPPKDENEFDRMHVEGLYLGHFRKTEKNDCEKYPTNCTGHIADYPCGWTSKVEMHTYHLDIALESDGTEPGSGGYTYTQLIDMWKAANATKSNLLMYWWSPEPLQASFVGTDAAFERVQLPAPTKECVETRFPNRCSDDKMQRVGESQGACDDPPNPLHKLIARSANSDSDKPVEIRSPAYEVLKLFRLSTLQLDEIYSYWQENKDNPRQGICRWVNDNMEFVEQLMPATYPRILREADDNFGGQLFYPSIIIACLSTLLVIGTGLLVHRHRNRRVIKFAQAEFLWLLLAGSLAKSVGSIMSAVPPTNMSCITSGWLVNVGYTLELVPLIVKTAAVNKLTNAAQSMRRVVMPRRSLFSTVLVITILAAVFMTVWTVFDAPQKTNEYHLTDDKISTKIFGAEEVNGCGGGERGNGTCPANGDGRCCSEDGYCGDTDAYCWSNDPYGYVPGYTVVEVRHYCTSQSDNWTFAAISWNALMLFIATVLAYQSRDTPQEFNESQTMAFMIYSHVVFVVLRILSVAMSDSFHGTLLDRILSLIYSIDTFAAILIYFLPKFFAVDDDMPLSSAFMSQEMSRRLAQRRNDGFGAIGIAVHRVISSISFLSQRDEDPPEGTNHATVDEFPTSGEGSTPSPSFSAITAYNGKPVVKESSPQVPTMDEESKAAETSFVDESKLAESSVADEKSTDQSTVGG